jgi:DNA-binding NarL/FixJ family response regulator
MRKLRILLADDHETVREGLKVILNGQPDMEVVGQAANGREAVSRAVELDPDMIIMDVSMPGANGLEATQAVKACCPRTRVITLTRHRDEGYIHELLRAGASGYVLKQSRADELLHAVRTVAGNRVYVDAAVAGQMLSGAARRSLRGTEATTTGLSAREEEVLRAVAWGYSNKEIGAKLSLSVKTVETHKANALQKLGLHNRVDVVRYALFKGWLQDG